MLATKLGGYENGENPVFPACFKYALTGASKPPPNSKRQAEGAKVGETSNKNKKINRLTLGEILSKYITSLDPIYDR